jgi:hypothetical protein
VLTIISPLFNILSRQIEITGQASENVIDLITCAIASIIFGTRAYVTYATIKEHQENGQLPSGANGSSKPTTTNRTSGSGGSGNPDHPIIKPSQSVSTGIADDPTDGDSGDSVNTRQDAYLFSELFNKDIEGRIRLGLLPPRIPATNE